MKATTTKSKIAIKTVYVMISVVFWAALWVIAAKKIGSDLLLPSPSSVFEKLAQFLGTYEFRISVIRSLLRVIEGYLIGVLTGTVLAVITSFLEFSNTLFSPVGSVIRATPVASFIMLTWLWLDSSDVPVFITALMVTPIVWNALKTAIKSTDPHLLELSKMYKFGFLKTLRAVYFPSVIKSYASALITSLGLGWKAGIAAEVLCQPPDSIGTGIYRSRICLEIPELFAWTSTVIILSVIMELVFGFIISHLMNKEKMQ